MHAGYIGRSGFRRGVRCSHQLARIAHSLRRRTWHGPAGWCAVASSEARVGRAELLERAAEHQPRSPNSKMVRLPDGKNSIQSSMGPTRNPHF